MAKIFFDDRKAAIGNSKPLVPRFELDAVVG